MKRTDIARYDIRIFDADGELIYHKGISWMLPRDEKIDRRACRHAVSMLNMNSVAEFAEVTSDPPGFRQIVTRDDESVLGKRKGR